jgi:hypothetical protein
MGRKELGLLFLPFNLNKGEESLRIVYYMGKRNSYSFPTFIKGLIEVVMTLVVWREICLDNVHLTKTIKCPPDF